jgi:hypothetical protein
MRGNTREPDLDSHTPAKKVTMKTVITTKFCENKHALPSISKSYVTSVSA